MCSSDLIDGKTFYEMGRPPSEDEAKKVIAEAAKINQIDFKPTPLYDEWAITGAEKEYRLVKPYLSDKEREAIEPLVSKYKNLDMKDLPHAFVHGDIINTNTIRSKNGDIYIIDFAVTNYYPRIIELALLKCNLLKNFDLDFIISEYEKEIKLTKAEKDSLPLFVNLAHTMHVIGASKEKFIHGNKSDENEYWLREGRESLGIK